MFFEKHMPSDCGTFTDNNKNTNTKINFEIKMKGNIAKRKGFGKFGSFYLGAKGDSCHMENLHSQRDENFD